VSRIRDLHGSWMNDPAYRKEYDALEGAFALAAALIGARAHAGLTQEQLAERMGTKRAVVARWEGGQGASLDPHPRADREGDRHQAANQFCHDSSGRMNNEFHACRPSAT